MKLTVASRTIISPYAWSEFPGVSQEPEPVETVAEISRYASEVRIRVAARAETIARRGKR